MTPRRRSRRIPSKRDKYSPSAESARPQSAHKKKPATAVPTTVVEDNKDDEHGGEHAKTAKPGVSASDVLLPAYSTDCNKCGAIIPDNRLRCAKVDGIRPCRANLAAAKSVGSESDDESRDAALLDIRQAAVAARCASNDAERAANGYNMHNLRLARRTRMRKKGGLFLLGRFDVSLGGPTCHYQPLPLACRTSAVLPFLLFVHQPHRCSSAPSPN